MSKKKSEIPGPFDPEKFRKEGHQLVDILSDYLQSSLSGDRMKVLPANDPDDLSVLFSFASGGGSNEPFNSYVKRIIDNSIHIHHPNYIGHQVTSPLPLTALIQFCTTLLNNGAAVYEMGPVNMAMERNVVKCFGKLLGYREGFDGIFTHGGTAGNLTAMLAARQTKTSYNIWEEGIRTGERPGFIMSEQSHYSISRNVKIMGLGDSSAVRIPFDNNYRMRADLLKEYVQRAEDKGIKVIAVIANACSTATGTYDDIATIADFCEKHDLWLHVDGAHGMGVLFSDKYKGRVKGIERADSVVIDFHKMFLIPALNTLVMFRQGDRSYNTFSQKASYLFRKTHNNLWYNSATRTIECTKSALGIIAYTALKYYGNGYYKEYVENMYGLASRFADMIRKDPLFELAVEPMSNIVCFRYIQEEADDIVTNRLNETLRENIVSDGTFYIVQTEIGSRTWLRTTIINPVTTEDTLKKLLTEIKKIAKKIRKQDAR
jgi:L-2,4-diaminobutyrate decarboxylase